MRDMMTESRDGFLFVELTLSEFEMLYARTAKTWRGVGATEGGTTWRLVDTLISMEHTGGDGWRYMVCPNYFLLVAQPEAFS